MKDSKMIWIIIAVVVVIALGAGYFLIAGNNTQNEEVTVQTQEQDQNQEIQEDMKTIVDIANEAGNFTTLVAAAQAAGLVETLSGTGPFTVFAPTDEAFAKLPEGTVEGLLKDPEKLADILKYHVVSGKVMSSEVVSLASADTVQGGQVTIKTENGTVMINNAKVVTPDIEASNGVIHVIDTVLLPN